MSNRVQGDYWEVEYTVTPVEIAGRTPIWLDNNGYEIETSDYYNHNFSIKGGFLTTFTLSYKGSTNPFRVDISRDGSATFDVWDHELSGGSEIELSAQTNYTPYDGSKGVDLYPGKSTCYYRVYEDGVLEIHLQAFLGPFVYYQTCYFTPNAEEGVEVVWYCNDSVMDVGEVYAFDLYTQYNFKLSYDQPADESYVAFNAYPNPGYGTFKDASEAVYAGPIPVVTGDKIYRDANDEKKLIIDRKNGTKETWTGVGHEGHTTFDNWSEFEEITVAPGRYYSLQANFHSDNVVVSIRSANKELGTVTPEVEDRLVKYGSKVETGEDAEGNLIITITEPEAADPIYTSVVNPNERSEFKE
ncbi:MAG: hypothetical protein Q4F54_00030 [Coriobacteriia bacterium]|nr:hypothetical protein [Coriobacteriia bacterium]